jgi:hypothetical protein
MPIAGQLTGADLPRLRRAGPAASDPKQTSESIRLAAYLAPLLHFRCGNSSDVEEAGDVDGQRISFVPQGSPSRAFHGPLSFLRGEKRRVGSLKSAIERAADAIAGAILILP